MYMGHSMPIQPERLTISDLVLDFICQIQVILRRIANFKQKILIFGHFLLTLKRTFFLDIS